MNPGDEQPKSESDEEEEARTDLGKAVREAQTHVQNAQRELEEAVATLWQAQDHSDDSPSEILRCAAQGLAENAMWVDHQFDNWYTLREGR